MVRSSGQPDYIFIFIVVCLILLGGLILVSVSLPISQEKFGSSFYYLNHQIIFGLLPGLILAFSAFKIKLVSFKKWAPIFLLINLIFLGMVFLPLIGVNFRGSARWINLGPISLQPSEFLKLSFILYLASWLESRTPHQTTTHPPPSPPNAGPLKFGAGQADKKFTPTTKKLAWWFSQTFFAFLAIMVITGTFLIFQPDISTLLVIILVATLMYFLAKTPLWHSILLIFMIILAFLVLIKIAPYRFNRILVFLNPELDPMGIGYQIKHALIAIGSGGIFGSGLGLSLQKFGFLPHSISDSIFAIFAEETGFIGSFILVLLYLIFFWRGLKIGKQSPEKFSKFCAFGITFWITLQAFVNIGSMIGILPLTGIPLPFISYGGSALISELIGVGILLNISKRG